MELDAVYGVPLDGIDVVAVPPDLAPLLATAHRRVSGRVAGAHVGDGRIVVPPVGASCTGAPVDDLVEALAQAERPIVLAGPGVIHERAVDGLRALAEAGRLGVLNTWGAKGVFDWTSPHHLATAGLQARDFELGGLADADLVVATGIDEAEVLDGWPLAQAVEVAPGDLRAVARRVHRSHREIAVPVLRTELARVTQHGWQVGTGPLPPSRVTLAYSQALGPSGLVAAEPGLAGYWVARTFPTSGIGAAIVPAEARPRGAALACAIVARRLDPARPVVAVVDEGVGPDAARLLDLAAEWDLAIAVEVWSPDGAPLDAAAHEARLRRLLGDGGIATLRTDGSQLARMVEVAGPVVAWGGLPVGQPG